MLNTSDNLIAAACSGDVATNDPGAFSITPTLHINVRTEARLAIDQINARKGNKS
jgi:hypothetical protein